MIDPAIDREGNTYEREAITEWIKLHGTSPITRNFISTYDLTPNRALRDAIAAMEEIWLNRQDMLLMLVGCKLISLSAENYLGQSEFYSLHKGVHSSVLKALSWRDFYVEILGFL